MLDSKTQTQDIILKETFEPGIRHALGSNFRKWEEAFLELMDNAVDNRIPQKSISIQILTSDKTLSIVNRGGFGMDIKKLEGFLRWGEIRQRQSYELGAYAQGGKAAMIYLGRTMKIRASANGENKIYIIEDGNFRNHDKIKEYKVMSIEFPHQEGFVEIEVGDLQRKINDDKLESLVADVYRPLIQNGDIEIKHNGKKIKVGEFPLDLEFKMEKFNIPVNDKYELERSGSGLTLVKPKSAANIHGWVGRLSPKSGIKGGMRCYWRGRLICDKEFFGHPDAHYKHTLNLLFGEVHLDHLAATTNKTDFDRDSFRWLEVQKAMYQLLKPHIDDLLGREIREPSEEEKERVKTAKELVAELMKLRKINLEGSSAIPTQEDYGQKPKEKEGDRKIYNRLNQRKNAPKTPPPPNAVGKRRRLKEFMEWELKPIDETIRSIIEKRGDKKVLVINNLFPGFKAATKSQLLYLIETAAMQLSKPDEGENITVNEYVESFDDLYSFFCSHLETVKENLQKRKNKDKSINTV